jgi:hypothetical protein
MYDLHYKADADIILVIYFYHIKGSSVAGRNTCFNDTVMASLKPC